MFLSLKCYFNSFYSFQRLHLFLIVSTRFLFICFNYMQSFNAIERMIMYTSRYIPKDMGNTRKSVNMKLGLAFLFICFFFFSINLLNSNYKIMHV